MAEQLFQQLEAEARTAEPAQASLQTASTSSYHAHAVDWTPSQPSQADANSSWEPQQAAISMSHMAVSSVVPINTSVSMVEVDDRRMSSGSFGDMPTHLAEQVCLPTYSLSCWLCCIMCCIMCILGWWRECLFYRNDDCLQRCTACQLKRLLLMLQPCTAGLG